MEYYQFSTFRKIKPEVLKSIYDYLEDCPSLLQAVIEELKTTYSIYDLSLKSSLYISKSYRKDDSFSESNFLNLFN